MTPETLLYNLALSRFLKEAMSPDEIKRSVGPRNASLLGTLFGGPLYSALHAGIAAHHVGLHNPKMTGLKSGLKSFGRGTLEGAVGSLPGMAMSIIPPIGIPLMLAGGFLGQMHGMHASTRNSLRSVRDRALKKAKEPHDS